MSSLSHIILVHRALAGVYRPLSAQIWLYQRRTVTVRGHRRALCFPAQDYLPGHHVHRNYLKYLVGGRAQAEAQIDPRPLLTSRSTAHGTQVV